MRICDNGGGGTVKKNKVQIIVWRGEWKWNGFQRKQGERKG